MDQSPILTTEIKVAARNTSQYWRILGSEFVRLKISAMLVVDAFLIGLHWEFSAIFIERQRREG